MKSILAGGLLALFATCANSAVYNGNRLAELCLGDRSFVTGYVVGMMDKASDDIGISSIRFAGDQRLGLVVFEIENYCVPAQASVGQAVDIFCKYLTENPGERHLPASILAAKSLSAVWPCKR